MTWTIASLLAGRDDQPALIIGDLTHTRGQLREAVAAAAAGLAARGLRRGDALALWLPNGPGWIQLFAAAAELGVLIVPISTRYKPPEVKHLLEVSRARAVVAQAHFHDVACAEILRGLQGELPSLESLIEVEPTEGFLNLMPQGTAAVRSVESDPGQGSDLLCCFSTSGTTGLPKLAAHDHASFARHVAHLSRGIDMRPGDAMLCALPLFGVFGLMTTLGALAGGGACVLLPVWDAEQAARAVERHRITHVIGADTMFDAMFRIEGVRFDSLRHGVQADFTGLVLPVTRRGDELGVAFSGTYGSSECYALMSLHPWDAPAEQRAQAGGIVTDETIEVRVVDPDTGHELADGEPGEIQIRGPNVLACYLNNPEATARAFTADGWFRSGDLGHRSGPGFVYLARMGDSLRLRGFLVNPAEIEACLMGHPSVAGAQVVGATRPGQGDVAVAWVLSSDSALDAVALESALIAHCRERMASYKVPVRIARLDEFPAISGPNGTKIQKRVLRDWARELV